ncbi:recombinase family protein [Candidatus Margulisiibacteriota bacterium]
MTKSILYARVSSKEQETEGFSIDSQIKLLKQYAKNKDFIIVKEYIDIETAKKAGRTQFELMKQYLSDHLDVKIILVEKTDRLYRNLRDYVDLEDFDIDHSFCKRKPSHEQKFIL